METTNQQLNQNQEIQIKPEIPSTTSGTAKISNQHQSDYSQLQQLLAPYDYLVCLSVETTHDQENFDYNYRRCFLDNTLAQIAQRLQPAVQVSNDGNNQLKDLEQAKTIAKMDEFIKNSNFPNIIQMNWCAYNLRKAVVEFDMSVHIRPTNMAQLNEETIEKTGVTQDELEKHGFTLQTAIQKFTDMAYNKILCRNQSFQIVTCGDWVLQYQFSIEAIQKQIRLGQHFQQFINILSLYYASVNFQASTGGPFIRDVPQILEALDLAEKNVPQRSKQMCQSLTRIINRLVVNMNQCKELSPRNSRQRRSRSRSRSQENDQHMKIEDNKPQQMPPTIQVVNCPAFIEQTDLAQFFNEIPFKTFEFKELPDGLRRTWTIELEKQEDLPKALALDGQLLKEEAIQVNQLQRSMATGGDHRPEDLVALRMRGLPFSAVPQDIMLFFSGYNIETHHIQIGKQADDRPSGQGAVLFENEDECKRAYTEKQGQHLGHRWIELYQMRYNEYQNFQETQKSNQKQVILNHYLTDANADRALRLRGLPWSATAREIVEFFDGYSIEESDIVIESKNGKPSGYALVFMKNAEDAKKARHELDRKNMGRRYVDVLFANQRH